MPQHSNATPLRIANACGFWGDSLDAPRRLVESAEVDFLTLEYLAELTMSILARQRQRDRQMGYAGDFVEVVKSLTTALQDQPQLRIVTNAGGMNPQACARAIAEVLSDAGLNEKIAVVSGDDIGGGYIEALAEEHDFTNLDTGEQLRDRLSRSALVSANAYHGAKGIVEALDAGARIVITGRVADASLTVGPAIHHFGWAWDDWNRLAAVSVAGHLIECGAQVTGGYSTEWANVPDLANIGYPIVELEDDGGCVVTKPPGSGGEVNRRTVVEQMVYEIGDPHSYMTPDVEVDFTTLHVDDQGNDRVRVTGATGCAAPENYKASLTYEDGYMASGQLLVFGTDCIAKANKCAEIILANTGRPRLRNNVELLGSGAGVPPTDSDAPPEVMLRITVADRDRRTVERFTRQFAPLITSGPAGLAGYAQSRRRVQPVLAHWPMLVPKALVQTTCDVRTTQAWNS